MYSAGTAAGHKTFNQRHLQSSRFLYKNGLTSMLFANKINKLV